MIRPLLLAPAIAMILLASCKDDMDDLDCSTIASAYNADIKPIITNNCATAGCHVTGSAQGDFSTYNGIKTAADNGKLEQRVIHDKNMPPSGPLPLDHRKKIKCWLEAGAHNN
jgi:hypothetical protein